jgi:hypothetical protein
MATAYTIPTEAKHPEPTYPATDGQPREATSPTDSVEEQVRKGLFLYGSDEYVNIRVLLDNNRMTSQFSKDKRKLAKFIARIDNDPVIKSVYVQLQVLNPACRKEVQPGRGVKRHHVSRYRWLVVDTLRPNKGKTNATEEEKKHSVLAAKAVRAHLQSLGWPEPIFCDSGNGWHLVWKIDLDNTQEHYQMLQSCLLALAARFNNEHAEIDWSLAEPEQLIKLWGTMVRKGENTPLRPWRRSSVVTKPDSVELVSMELLQQLAAEAPTKSPSTAAKNSGHPELDADFDPEDFFEWCQENLPEEYQGFFNRDAEADHDDADSHHYVMDGCFWAERKHSGDLKKTEFILGKTFGFKCFSDDCDGIGIGDILRKVTKLAGKPYPGQIWVQDESILGDVDFVDEVDVLTGDEDDAGFDVEIPDNIIEPEPDASKVILDGDALEALINQESESKRKKSLLKSLEPAEIANLSEDDKREMQEASEKAKAFTTRMQKIDEEAAELEKEVQEQDEPTEETKLVDPDMHFVAWVENPNETGMGLLVKNAASYELAELQWMWPQKIPKGKISLLTGKPDSAKSLVSLDLSSRVSTGSDWPDGSKNEGGAGRVLIAATEDDPEDTIIPRLIAAGANLRNIDIVVGTVIRDKEKKKRRMNLNLKRDAKMLLEAIKRQPDIRLLVLDPVTSYFGDADQNKDKDIRPIMDEITRMCNKSGITVVGIIHSNKRSDVDAVHKVSGAGALAAAVRAVWGFSRDTEDKKKYHMAHVKGNLCKDKRGLDYSIEECMVPIKGKNAGTPRIVWGEQTEEDADDRLNAERNNKDVKDTKSLIAIAVVRSVIPAKAKDIYRKAEAEGISVATIKRARYQMGDVLADKINGEWWWFTADNTPEKMMQDFKGEEASQVQLAAIALAEETSRCSTQTKDFTVSESTVHRS